MPADPCPLTSKFGLPCPDWYDTNGIRLPRESWCEACRAGEETLPQSRDELLDLLQSRDYYKAQYEQARRLEGTLLVMQKGEIERLRADLAAARRHLERLVIYAVHVADCETCSPGDVDCPDVPASGSYEAACWLEGVRTPVESEREAWRALAGRLREFVEDFAGLPCQCAAPNQQYPCWGCSAREALTGDRRAGEGERG